MKLAAFTLSTFILFSISSAQQMGSFTDPRDRKTYKTVEIGSYTWMAENLNHKVADSFCYGKKESNCQKYGRLYSGPDEDLCPQGWRIPSYDEWENLEEAVGGTEIMGQMLKSTKGWKNGGNGSDSFGFNALPAGILSYEGTSARLGETTCFLGSEVNPNATVNEWCFDYNENGLTFGSMDLRYGGGASVRCVKDTPPNAEFQQEIAGIGDYEEEDEVDTFVDPRDGKTYKTVKIGNNIWMTENLNYEIGNSWCFENDPYNCTYYGRLYQWKDALEACPDGWNLPSKEDYAIFETDKDVTNRFKVYGSKLFLWSSTDKNNSNAYILRLDDDGASIRDIDKTKGISVRCIKRGRVFLKEITALSTKPTKTAFEAFRDKAANHTNKLDSLKGFGKSQFGERRGKANDGFNEGFATGGGFSDLLGGGEVTTHSAINANDRDVSISGGDGYRSKADIMKVVKQRSPGLRHIYNKSLKTKPGFSGNVTLRFTIGPKGDIISISIASSTTGYAEFDNQIKAAFSKWNFGPVQSGNTTVTLPFSFSDDQNTSSTTKNTDKENYRETLAPDCQRMYDNFVNDIPTQETTICRLSGVEDSENVILGFFFRFENFQEGLLVYGTNYDPYLHIDEPRFFAKVHCIENDQYRKLTQVMTSEEIAEKLLSFKNCSK